MSVIYSIVMFLALTLVETSLIGYTFHRRLSVFIIYRCLQTLHLNVDYFSYSLNMSYVVKRRNNAQGYLVSWSTLGALICIVSLVHSSLQGFF